MIIYKATNLINNKTYIGQTVLDLNTRRRQHENSYIDDEGNIIQPENSASIKNRPVRNIDTDEIFNTAQEAEIYYTGKKSGNLNRVCKGQRKTFAGYRWEYV